jgi:hypothetical protein
MSDFTIFWLVRQLHYLYFLQTLRAREVSNATPCKGVGTAVNVSPVVSKFAAALPLLLIYL